MSKRIDDVKEARKAAQVKKKKKAKRGEKDYELTKADVEDIVCGILRYWYPADGKYRVTDFARFLYQTELKNARNRKGIRSASSPSYGTRSANPNQSSPL